MKTPRDTNTPTDPEAELTMRALDPFFETGSKGDHANQWDISALWSNGKWPAAEEGHPRKADGASQ